MGSLWSFLLAPKNRKTLAGDLGSPDCSRGWRVGSLQVRVAARRRLEDSVRAARRDRGRARRKWQHDNDQRRWSAGNGNEAMRRGWQATIGLILATTALLAAAAAADVSIDAAPCGVAAGRDATNNITTCNYGLTPAQLKELIEAAVKGATEPLARQIADISKTLGVTENAAKTLLKIVGEDPNIPDDKLAEALSNVAIDFQRLKAQVAALNPDNPTAKALVEQAEPEIEAGHFQRAHELLRQATQAQIAAAQAAERLEQQAHDARDAQMLGAARSTAVDGDVAMTERRYQEGARLFGEAADYVPARYEKEQGRYFLRQADALYLQGDERGDNDALRSSIEVFGRALADYPRSQAPLEWAAIQDHLGNALSTLGNRESDTRRLEQAVAAYRRALEEQTLQRVPLDWGTTQNDLGTALAMLGRRDGETVLLKEAVTAFRAALEVRARERTPLDWAATQNNLGLALELLMSGRAIRRGLRRRPQRIARRLRKERASGLRSMGADAEQSRHCACGARRAGERNGAARGGGRGLSRGAGGNDARASSAPTGRQCRTISASRFWRSVSGSGTEARGGGCCLSRGASGMDARAESACLGETQTNLGDALTALGERDIGTARLEEAVAAYRAALEERTRERVPGHGLRP